MTKACKPDPSSATPTPTPAPTPTPTSPPPNPQDHGNTYGDPHLVTFDGVHYDFQQVGEFVLVRSGDLQVQVRQAPWGGSSTTVAENSAVAFAVAGHRVGGYTTAPPSPRSSTASRSPSPTRPRTSCRAAAPSST